MLGEEPLAGVGFEMGKALAGVRQHQIAFAQLRKPHQLQRFAEVKYLVRLELQVACENGQIGVPVIRRACQRFDQARKHVGGDVLEDHADARAGNTFDGRRFRLGALRHAGIDAVDELSKDRIETIAGVWQVDLDLGIS